MMLRSSEGLGLSLTPVGTWVVVVLSWILIALPVVIAFVAGRRKVVVWRRFLARAVKTPATVIEAPSAQRQAPVQGAQLVRPIAIYYAADGSTHQTPLTMTWSGFFTQGQQVDLLVDPADPGRAILAGRAGEKVRTGGILAIGIVLSVLIALPVLVVWAIVALTASVNNVTTKLPPG